MSKRRTALVAVVALIAGAGALYAITAMSPVKPAMWGTSADAPPAKRWQAVAPGRIEACSGQIKVATAVVGVVQKVLVKTNDKVFAGEALIQLADDELRARLAAAETQYGLARARPGREVGDRQRQDATQGAGCRGRSRTDAV